MTLPFPLLRRIPRGFSLVEVLVTVMILAVLLTVAGSGWKKSWRSQEILASAIRLSQDLSLARSLAIKRGHPVEVRFYQARDRHLTSIHPEYKTWQIVGFEPAQKRIAPLGELQRLESTIIMSRHRRLSSIVASARPLDVTRDPMPLMQTGIEISSVEFRPDGSTSLDPDPAQTWTITLLTDEFADEQSDLPPDFRTLIIAPENGAVTVY